MVNSDDSEERRLARDVSKKDESEDDLFEGLLDAIGSNGYYQKRFNLVFNLALITFFSMPFVNYILAMTVPEHWCKVTGRESTNITMERWKEIVIPRERSPYGEESFSKCHMFNLTLSEIMMWNRSNLTGGSQRHVIECDQGWEYDRNWYRSTIPADHDWVCDKDLYVTNTFVYGRVGDVLGTLIFGQLGDIIGRKPVFLISLSLVVIGRLAITLTAEVFPLFAIFMLLANSCTNAVFQSPLAIGMEVSGKALHSRINAVQYFGWTVGLSVMPFVAWVCQDWKIFIVITTIPTGFFILLYRIIPESPRWLAAKNNPVKAAKILSDIAKVNKKELPADCMNVLKHISESCQKQKCYGIISLFSSTRLAFNTTILLFCWIVTPLSYDVLILNVNTLSGNPFLNFFYMSIVELPAYVVGMWLTESLGRRWTHVVFLIFNFFICCTIIIVETYFDLNWLFIALVVLSKFCISLTFYVLYLQSLEIYPTCLRQTGSAAGVIMASLFGVLGPYIVYMGTTMDSRFPFVFMAATAFVGSITASLLPETLNQQLPETLDEAQVFGKNQNYWSFAVKFSFLSKDKKCSIGKEEDLAMEQRPLRRKH